MNSVIIYLISNTGKVYSPQREYFHRGCKHFVYRTEICDGLFLLCAIYTFTD